MEQSFCLILLALVCGQATAQNNGDIRLVGQDKNSGRLEVFLNQGWGTVCYNTPSPGAARAACRQLGYSDCEKVDTVKNMGFQPGSGNILLSNVQCDDNSEPIARRMRSITQLKRVLQVPSLTCAGQRQFHVSANPAQVDQSYQFVVCGAGAGGLAMASILRRRFGPDKLVIIDPAENHYYQPMFTLIGAGAKTLEQSCRPMSSLIPPQAKWLQTAVTKFNPEENTVETSDGKKIGYDYLIVALGLQLNFNAIKGLPEALKDPDSLVASNYSPDTVEKTFANMRRFRGGNAIFTFPPMPIKCPGAPQKIMYLADDYWRKAGVRDNATIMYNTSLGVIFGVKKYAERLLEVVKKKGIELNYKHKLVEVNVPSKEAVFEVLEEDRTVTFKYDFLHATPPMSALDFMKDQPISDEAGWVDVDKETLQHKKYPNIFGIGDCTNVPTSRTAAACASESAVIRKNLLAVMRGETPTAHYDGYTSCPLITGYGKTILAEFDFDALPLETFPFDQGKERASMYYLKKDVLPEVYWQGLLKGIWGGPGTARKIMHLGTGK